MNLKDLQALALVAMTTTFSCDQLAGNDSLKSIETENAAQQSSSQHAIYRTMGCCRCTGRGQNKIGLMATHKDLL